MDHKTFSTRMEEDQSLMIPRIQHLILEIIYLLTGESFCPVKSGDQLTITVLPPSSMTPERHKNEKILEATKKITELLTGEVPIRCQDVSVYFSMEEWEYLEGHKELYKGVMMENDRKFCDLITGKETFHLKEMSLNLALEMIKLLKSQDCTIEKRPSAEQNPTRRDHWLPPKFTKSLTSITEPPSLKPDIENDLEILDVIKKMMELLTGEEWEYLEGHKELYNDIMMASQPTLTSPDGSSNGIPPARCPCHLYPLQDPTIPHHHQGEELKEVKKEEEEEMLVSGALQSKEEREMIMQIKEEESSLLRGTNGRFDPNTSEGEPIGCVDSKVEDDDITQSSPGRDHMILGDGRFDLNTSEGEPIGCVDRKVEDDNITQSSSGTDHMTPITHHRADHVEASMDPFNPEESSDPYHTMMFSIRQFHQSVDRLTDPSNHKALSLCDVDPTGARPMPQSEIKAQPSFSKEHPFSCSQCSGCFTKEEHLLRHQRRHTGERPFSCSECEMCFIEKRHLISHQKSHTDERPHSCSECEKRFKRKQHLLIHQRSHTGERPFSCSECEKCFTVRVGLRKHQRVHTGMHPYSCSECGKSFIHRAQLLKHHRTHTGERPFSCLECGLGFIDKVSLRIHQRIHTGERPYSCSDCEKCFSNRRQLNVHRRTHTGERPFSCTECDKSFSDKGNLLKHHRVHTGERPFSCLECGKSFTLQKNLQRHQFTHTR